MHEMGIAIQIIDIATASIPEDMQGIDIKSLNLRVGKLSAVVPSSLKFCFEIAAQGTALEGAELVMEEIPVVARCQECPNQWTIEGPVFQCPQCESGKIEIISGRELDIVSLELAD